MRQDERRAILLAAAPLLVLALLIGSCGDDRSPLVPGDTTAPAAAILAPVGGVTTTSVQLTWVAPGDDVNTGTADHYDIRYSTAVITAANFSSATAVTGAPTPAAPGTSQSVTVSGLTPNTLYYFAMRTADEVPNWSGLSNVVQGTTGAAPADTTPPAAATLAVGTVTTTTVQLTWTAPGDDGTTGTASRYDIRYSTSAITAVNFASATAVTGAPIPAAVGTSQSVTVSGLAPNTPYYFAMKTADEVPNWSDLSNVAQATTGAATGDTTAPAATTNLTAGVATATSVGLTWTAPGDDGTTGTAQRYDVRYSTSAITAVTFESATAVTGVPAPSAAGAPQGWTVSGLNPNTQYFFALKTADEVPNWSDLSNVVQATTAQPPDVTPPAPVTSLAAGTVTSTTVQLTWTAPGDDGSTGTAHQYDIRFSISQITPANFASATALPGAPAPAAAGTLQSVTLNGLAPNTPYYFALKAADEVLNWSDLSNVAQATTAQTADTAPPAAITDLAATPADSTDVLLTWTAPGDDEDLGTASQYDIRYATANITEANWAAATPVSGAPAPAANGTPQSMHVTGLHPGTDYFFAVKTSDEVPNISALSNVATAQTPTGPTNPPMISALDLPDSVCISSTDQYAQMAKLLATVQMAMAQGYANLGAVFFAQLNNADWQQTGDCWDYTVNISTCTFTYHVCKTGSNFEYTMTYDGPCFGQNYSNWVAYRVNFDSSTRTGTFYWYESNTTNIQVAWIWTESADGLSGTYTFYEGDPATAPVQVSIEYVKSADGNTTDVTFTSPGQSKWVSSFTKVPCSGWLKMYQWDDTGSRWWLENDIAWNAGGTGFYDTYDDTGQLQEHHTW